MSRSLILSFCALALTAPVSAKPAHPVKATKAAVPALKTPAGPPEVPLTRNVRRFGAKGDGRTDDTAAFQRGIDAVAKDGGGILSVPRGDYLIKGHLTVREHVTVEGIFRAPTARTQYKGSTLLAVEETGGMDGTPFITLLANGTLRGITVYYPHQSQTAPKPYPWTVRGIGDNCSLVDVLLVNPYAAVDFGTQPAGRHFINGLYAQAIYRGVFVDKCFDVGRINNVHLWPFWTEKLMDWTLKNGEAFTIARTDWEYMANCFCISYKVGYHFVGNADGPGNAVLTTCGSDVGDVAVLVDGTQGHAGVSFVNGQFMGDIRVSPSNTGPVKFTACGFWGVAGRTQTYGELEGHGQTSFENCHFIAWDQQNNSTPAIHAVRGGLSVIGCDFMEAGKQQIVLEKAVEAATIVGNRFRGGEKVVNNSTGSVEIGLNAKQ